MLKHAQQLSSDLHEFGFVEWGQSNARPWGHRDLEGYIQEPDLALRSPGMDLRITAISGSTVSVADTLVANNEVGAEVRMITLVRGNANLVVRPGIGIVTANTTSQLTVTWSISPPSLPVGGTVTLTEADDKVNLAGHTFVAGDRVSFSGGSLPSGVNPSTDYWVVNPEANKFQIAATMGGAALTWAADSSGTVTATPHIGAYLHHQDRWKTYPGVRVLTPYQPEVAGGYPTAAPKVPGYTFPASIASYEDAALFLDFSWYEGVEGPGYVGACTESGGVVTLTPALPTWVIDDVLIGATVMLSSDNGGRWVGTAVDNAVAGKTITVAAWTPATVPSGTLTVEVHLPHWLNNAHHALHGFRYPSNDMQPGAIGGLGEIYNRPSGRLTPTYIQFTNGAFHHRFGAAVAFAWRMAVMLGKRAHMILLGINGAGLQMSPVINQLTCTRVIGWWDWRIVNDWTPSNPVGAAARLKRLISIMAPAALLAEGSNKTLKLLGALGFQGEADSMSITGRTSYLTNLSEFYAWLRSVIVGAGMSPYPTTAKIPVVHASLHPNWGDTIWLGPNADYYGLTNAAIAAFAATDGFAATFSTADSPHLDGATAYGTDKAHFNGRGEAINGRLASEAMGDIIDFALGFQLEPGAVAVANEALSLIGEAANVTSLSPANATRQAQLCAQFFSGCKQAILQYHPWSCATKRVALQAIANTASTWAQAYAVPADLLTPIDVLDPAAPDDLQIRGSTVPDPYGLPVTGPMEDSGQTFRLETEGGIRVLRTDQENAVVRYVSLNSDVDTWDPMMRQALTWHLAHKLVGATVKGKVGATLAQQYLQTAMALLDEAAQRDAADNQNVRPDKKAPWLP